MVWLHKVPPAYRRAGERLGKWYLLCVINSSHTSKLTFSKLCTVVMDTSIEDVRVTF
jgi:hypothetical protein